MSTYLHQSAESAVTPVESYFYTKPGSSTVEGSSQSRRYSTPSCLPIPFLPPQTIRLSSRKPTTLPSASGSPGS